MTRAETSVKSTMVAPSGTSGPAYRVKSTSSVKSEYGYPRGHLGNLSENEEEALHRFQIFLEEKGAYRPGAPPSHDDATLLYVCPHLSTVTQKDFPTNCMATQTARQDKQ